jgi:metacaspase-1
MRPKLMPEAVAMRTYTDNQAFYDQLQAGVAKAVSGLGFDPDAALAQVVASGRLTATVTKFNPSVILISGCQDNQTSMDGDHNGAFTEALLKVWNHGAFSGSYASLHAKVRSRLPGTQSPNLFTLGSTGAFLAQQPFTV